MTLCIFCDRELQPGTKPEHILQSALGGRKALRSIVCDDHNETFGSTIDRALPEQVQIIRNMLQLDSGTGKSPPMLRNIRAGSDVLNVRGDGTLELVEKPFAITQREDGSYNVQIKARSAEHLAALIPHIAAKLGIPEEQLRDQMRASQASLVSKRPGQVRFSLSFGGSNAIRSMMKSCLELWATIVGNDEIRSQPYDTARNFVLSGGSEFLQNRTHLDSRPLPHVAQLAARFGDIFNLIYVRSDGSGRVVGHFTLYNILAWQMVLAERGGQPNVAIGLISNPLDPGTWSDTIATEIEIDWAWLNAPAWEDYAHAQARVATMMEIYSRKGLEREMECIIRSVFERCGVTEGTAVSDESVKQQIVREISQRVASHLLSLPYEQRLEPAEMMAALMGGRKT